ncbi:hypothetical protein [Dinoroseobacter sp. S375]|uniref:hypothetical protein n=1 Tax=Dinoroseobacter sp. S375 TaxID=3415136 RepID=UPI003C7B80B4
MTRSLFDGLPLPDQLAMLRARLRALKAEEATLRAQILAAQGTGALRGLAYDIRIVHSTQRSILKERLPLEIQSNPRFFRRSEIAQVRLVQRAHVPAADARDAKPSGSLGHQRSVHAGPRSPACRTAPPR